MFGLDIGMNLINLSVNFIMFLVSFDGIEELYNKKCSSFCILHWISQDHFFYLFLLLTRLNSTKQTTEGWDIQPDLACIVEVYSDMSALEAVSG